jgi:hypothetical protein
MNVDRNSVMRKENTVEDQDRKTPEEEAEVEGHSIRDAQDLQDAQAKDDDFEAHSLRDAQDLQDAQAKDDDFEAHSLRDVQDVQDAQRGDDKDAQDVL